MTSADDLEELLAEALAKFDQGGESAMAAFVAAHPKSQAQLERGIRRCREMGLLGTKPTTEAHPERLGDYRLVRRLGGGGMGVVYEAVQEPLDRRVALKLIRPELLYFEGARERFRREIDAIARLEHPSIVPIYASGEHDGMPYYAMELLAGVTVDGATSKLQGRDPAELTGADLRGLMPVPAEASGELFDEPWWRLAVRVGNQVALAMRHAHLRGIVHRDIKPSNVVVTPHGQPVVLDFGVAQVQAAHELTRSGGAPGSPAFMSPEQRRGLATDERTDVFSLAATIWQLLTLQRPFKDAMQGVTVQTLPSLGRLVRTAPSELDLVLRTAMDPDRDRRYRDMGAFAEDLQAVAAHRPIAARPLGAGLRFVRWCQRHRVAAASGVVALVAAVALVVVLLVVQSNLRLVEKNAAMALAQEQAEAAIAQQQAAAALAHEQAATRASLDTTLEALHTILVRLGNEQLRAVPQAEKIAHGALEDAAALYRELLARHPDNETVRWQGGRALHALAMSLEHQGELAKAIATGEEAIDVLADGSDGRASASIVNVRAHALMALAGWHAENGDKPAALATLARTEADLAILERIPSQRAEALRQRGETQTSVSILLDESSEPEKCEQALLRAVELQRECMALAPVPRDRGMLAMRLANLGKFYHRQDRGPEARARFEESLAISKELPATGEWPPASKLVADAEEGIGQVLLRAKDPEAETFLLASVKTRERLVEQFPANMTFKIELGGAMHNYAQRVFAAGGRTEEALGWFVRARDLERQALEKSPKNIIALDFLGKHLEMIGYCHLQLRNGPALIAAGKELAELPAKSPVVAARAAELALRAWLMGDKQDGSLVDDAMARLLVAEQRGLKKKQIPKVFELMPDRPDFAAWKTRMEQR